MTNMETLFIGYPPCSTCKKAYKALLDLGIEATYRNIKEENPTKEEIQSWIDRGVELKKLFNTSGMLYRELNIKEKRETYTQEQLIDLLASNGMLVKRPIVIQGDMIIIGNKVSEYEKLQKRSCNG
jgi:arsenate reductase